MTSPQLPCALIAQLGFLVADAPQPAQSASSSRARPERPAPLGPPGLRRPHAAAIPRTIADHRHMLRNPGPPASAPGHAGRCHNNRVPAAEAAGEEVTSGGLAVVRTRDPGSVLTGQTAEKELGKRGRPGAGAPELETAGGRGAGRGAGQAGRPGAAGLGCESGGARG